jgi:hypothetical protein
VEVTYQIDLGTPRNRQRGGDLMATTSTDDRHPDWIDPEFDLVGVDGNAFAVMGAVSKALRRAGNSKEVCDAYTKSAMGGDYDHLLQVSMLYAGMLDPTR